MIVYNTTFYIEKDCVDSCLEYLKEKYIPAIVADEVLRQPSLRRVLFVQEDESESYALQFHVADMDVLQEWLERRGHVVHKQLVDTFGSKVVGFSTLLEELDWER